MLTLALLGLVGGLITGVSPCVLPMLPIIFFAGASGTATTKTSTPAPTASESASGSVAGSAGGSGAGGTATEVLTLAPPAIAARRRRDLRPLIIIGGLVVSFSVFTLLGSALLSALGLPDGLLRWIGLAILSLIGLGLIIPPLGHLIEKPFYRLPQIAKHDSSAFVFGLGLGTLYVPCAGPILAAITVAGATGQIGLRTVVLTIAFAVGAAAPLLVFAAAGAKIRNRINAFQARARLFRVIGGVVMVLLALALAFNATGVLQRAVPAYTGSVEKKLAESKAVQGALSPFPDAENKDLSKCTPGADALASCGTAPALRGTQSWFNTPGRQPITLTGLRGKVVLLDFWAYSCINCQRDAPYIENWYRAYASDGLEVIGIHSPEFAFEKSASNLSAAIDQEKITYPVVQDNDLKTWSAYRNRYWPAKYLIDTSGTVRAINFGEGNYQQTESLIRQLLTEKSPGTTLPAPVTDQTSSRIVTPADQRTQEMYLSPYRTQTGYAGPSLVSTSNTVYTLNPDQPADTYSYGGHSSPGTEDFKAVRDARIRLHYRAANVYNVISGSGTVTVSRAGVPDQVIRVSGEPNSYPLVQGSTTADQTITVSYSPGLTVFTFSFG